MVGLEDDYPRNPYFGEPWPSGVCEGAPRCPTPVGEKCVHCDEPIQEGDQGSMIGCMMLGEDKKSVVPSIRPEHRECQLRAVLGSIGHLKKKCSCYGGEGHDEPGMTRRQSAMQVWDWVQTHGV